MPQAIFNFPAPLSSHQSHVGYDARLALGNYRGMGAWMRELIRGREAELLGFCASGESDPLLHLQTGGARFFPLWEQFSLPRHVEASNVTTLVCSWNTAPLHLSPRVRLILAIHDLIYLEPFRRLPMSRSLFQNAGRLYRRWVAPRAIRKAYKILVPSNSIKHDLTNMALVDPSRITVIPNTIAENWFDLPALSPSLATPPVILCISGEAPSKNLERGIQALALLNRSHGPLTLRIGGVSRRFHARFSRLAQTLGIDSSIEWLPFLEEAQLQECYRMADVVFVPSLYEGFGRPLLEAMAAETPVVATDIPVLREIGGGAPKYCDPHSPVSMAQALTEVLTSTSLRASMKRKGSLQALAYHPVEVRKQIDCFWHSLDRSS